MFREVFHLCNLLMTKRVPVKVVRGFAECFLIFHR